MKRKRFTALKVTLTAMMLTAALTSGAGSAYAADLSQEGGSEPTVTIITGGNTGTAITDINTETNTSA